MNTLAFTKHLKSKGLQNVFPNNIPSDLNPIGGYATSVFSYFSTMDRYLTRGTLSLQFIVTHSDLNVCEQKANSVLDWLLNNDLTGDVIEDFEILTCSINQLNPMYIGIDDQKRYRWSFNIDLQIKKFKL